MVWEQMDKLLQTAMLEHPNSRYIPQLHKILKIT
jgi:hypothetical protein